jgi:hypothetical protein
MNNKFCLPIIIGLFATTSSAFCQKIPQSDSDIDPSIYLVIYENSGKDNLVPVWYMKKDSLPSPVGDTAGIFYYPYQKYDKIGTDAILDIHFDKKRLAKNIDFKGSISLEAEAGSHKVEIDSYYEIGETKSSYGVDSKPIKEIAQSFLRLMTECVDGRNVYRNFDTLFSALSSERIDYVNKIITNEITRLNSRAPASAITQPDMDNLANIDLLITDKHKSKSKLNDVLTITRLTTTVGNLKVLLTDIKNNLNYNSVAKDFIYPTEGQQYRRFLNIRLQTPADDEEFRNKDFNKKIKIVEQSYESYYRAIKAVGEQINYISQSDDNTIKAFLSFTSLTITDFRMIVDNLNESIGKLENCRKLSDLLNRTDQDVMYYLSQTYYVFEKLSNNSFKSATFSKYKNLINDIQKHGSKALADDVIIYSEFRDELASQAGRLIFSNLIRGRIDVAGSKLNDGDVLEIFLVWNKQPKDTVQTDKTRRIPVGKFTIKKMGWHLDVSEAALLIHRIDEEKLRLDYPLSPSNFKPTAGASMLWSYYNTFRTRERLKKGVLKEYGFLKFIHWLEPSFGINVSYTDFRTDRDVEFGAGPVVGLFQNRIFLTTGYNLSVNGESPFYMGIGFSFSNIYQRIKDNEGK